ncbi:retrovirus-related Pol polyprotein from transposon TNT 1-94, partial [Trichonephila clavata]
MEVNNQIPVLTQNNWNTWKHDMQVILMHYGCWQFIIQTKPEEPDEGATYKEKCDFQLRKDRCYMLIYTNISSDLKNLIIETTDGVVAWKILKDHFEPVTRARVIQLLGMNFRNKIPTRGRCRNLHISCKDGGNQATRGGWKEEDFTAVKIEAELILEANRLQLMKQDLEKTETVYFSNFLSKKLSKVPRNVNTVPGGTTATPADPSGKTEYQKKD